MGSLVCASKPGRGRATNPTLKFGDPKKERQGGQREVRKAPVLRIAGARKLHDSADIAHFSKNFIGQGGGGIGEGGKTEKTGWVRRPADCRQFLGRNKSRRREPSQAELRTRSQSSIHHGVINKGVNKGGEKHRQKEKRKKPRAGRRQDGCKTLLLKVHQKGRGGDVKLE